jgi:hypothetical protein
MLVGKPEQKKLLVRPKYREESSIKVFVKNSGAKVLTDSDV